MAHHSDPRDPIQPSWTSSSETSDENGPFWLDPHLGVETHADTGWQVVREFRRITVYSPSGGRVGFNLESFPQGEWHKLAAGVEDYTLPLEIRRTGSELQMRWTFTPSPPGRRPCNIWESSDPADLAANRRLLEELRDLRHGTASQQIGDIRY